MYVCTHKYVKSVFEKYFKNLYCKYNFAKYVYYIFLSLVESHLALVLQTDTDLGFMNSHEYVSCTGKNSNHLTNFAIHNFFYS